MLHHLTRLEPASARQRLAGSTFLAHERRRSIMFDPSLVGAHAIGDSLRAQVAKLL